MVNINGTLFDELPPEIEAVQRALYYGDTLFETVRVFGGSLPLWPAHWERLRTGSRLLDYDWPEEWSSDFFLRAIQTVLPGPQARVRITVWRSPGGLYCPDNNIPQYLVRAQALHGDCYEWQPLNMSVGVSESVRLPIDAYSGLKTLNAARYVAAALEAKRAGWDDALLLNANDHICEATGSNVFWWEDDHLCTPPLSDGPVTGTFRNLLLRAASVKGISVHQKSLSKKALLQAEEVFLTNAVQGIRPVRYFEEKEYRCSKTKELFEETVSFLKHL